MLGSHCDLDGSILTLSSSGTDGEAPSRGGARRRLDRLVVRATSLLLLGVLAACSPTEPAFTRNPPPPVVIHGHVAWRLRSGSYGGIGGVELTLGVRNFSSDTIRALYVGGACPLSRAEAYREGEWDRPVWLEPDTSACPAVPRRPLLLAPGDSTNAAYWSRRITAGAVLGDSLETGYYRIGVRGVPLDSLRDSAYEAGAMGWSPARAELAAPEPVKLVRTLIPR